jgi:hypothetical protein
MANRLRTQAGGALRALPDRDVDLFSFAAHWLLRDIWPIL